MVSSGYLIDGVSADVNINPNLPLEDLAVVVYPLGLVSTEIEDDVKPLCLPDDLHELPALVDRVDVAVRGVLVRGAGGLVVAVALHSPHVRT